MFTNFSDLNHKSLPAMSPSVCEANTLDLQHQKEDRKIKRIFVKKLNIKGQNNSKKGKQGVNHE